MESGYFTSNSHCVRESFRILIKLYYFECAKTCTHIFQIMSDDCERFCGHAGGAGDSLAVKDESEAAESAIPFFLDIANRTERWSRRMEPKITSQNETTTISPENSATFSLSSFLWYLGIGLTSWCLPHTQKKRSKSENNTLYEKSSTRSVYQCCVISQWPQKRSHFNNQTKKLFRSRLSFDWKFMHDIISY